MKGKLLRVCVVARDADETMKDFHDLFGVEFYGPFDDEGTSLRVALPRSGGMEVSAPASENDPIGFSNYLKENGEGIKGIVFRVDDIAEAMEELKTKGVTLGVYFEHDLMKECIIPPQPATHGIEVALNEFPDEDPVGQAVARDMGIDLYA